MPPPRTGAKVISAQERGRKMRWRGFSARLWVFTTKVVREMQKLLQMSIEICNRHPQTAQIQS